MFRRVDIAERVKSTTLMLLMLLTPILWSVPKAEAAVISLPYVAVNGQTLSAANWNADFNTIYDDYNGNVDNANIANGAAIYLGKLSYNPGFGAFNKLTTGHSTWSSGLETDTDPSVGFTSDGYCFFETRRNNSL